MQAKVYLETTVISYLTGWPSRDLVTAAHQRLTRDWWEKRARFDLYVSQVVFQEAVEGDSGAASARLQVLEEIQVLLVTPEARDLAAQLVGGGAVPEKAAVDALHISIAVVNGMDYLLTWNCAHIANATMRHRIEGACRAAGYDPPVICTPEELMEE